MMDNPPLERAALELIFYMLIYVPRVLIRATEFRWWSAVRWVAAGVYEAPRTTLKIINRKVGGVGPSVHLVAVGVR